MNRPVKFDYSHPACQWAAERLREAGFVAEYNAGYQEWFVRSNKAAALDRNIHKVLRSLCAKLLHRKHMEEYEAVRKIMLGMDNL